MFSTCFPRRDKYAFDEPVPKQVNVGILKQDTHDPAPKQVNVVGILKKNTIVHKSASFGVVRIEPPQLPCQATSYSVSNGESFIKGILNGDPCAVGRTGKLYLTPDKNKILKKVRFPEHYFNEKEMVEKLCDGKCKFILNNVKCYDNLRTFMMPYYDMDAHTYVQKHGYLCEKNGKNMCMNLSLGLFYIHAKGLVYGDLKLENVCVRNGDTDTPIIIDIGSCHRFKPTITLETASPEALRGESVTYKHDIWTLGIFFMEITTSCVVNPNKVRNERSDWYSGPDVSMKFLRSHSLFASCTIFDRNKRICNFFNLKNKN